MEDMEIMFLCILLIVAVAVILTIITANGEMCRDHFGENHTVIVTPLSKDIKCQEQPKWLFEKLDDNTVQRSRNTIKVIDK